VAKRYKLTRGATNDLEEIARYTQRRWGMAQRVEYLATLEQRLEQLTESPRTGIARDEIVSGLRSARHGRHVIFYQENAEGIIVSRVLHSSMDLRRRLPSLGIRDEGDS
jgi:toxin ParE1/3/4